MGATLHTRTFRASHPGALVAASFVALLALLLGGGVTAVLSLLILGTDVEVAIGTSGLDAAASAEHLRQTVGWVAVTGLGSIAVLIGAVVVAARARALDITVGLHGVRWGGRFVLYEQITSVERDGASLTVCGDGHVLRTGLRRVDDLDGLEAALREGIRLEADREERADARRAVEALQG